MIASGTFDEGSGSPTTPVLEPQRRVGFVPETLRVGLVGCGAFAKFSLTQYRQLPGVTISGVADIDPAAAQRAAAELQAAIQEPVEEQVVCTCRYKGSGQAENQPHAGPVSALRGDGARRDRV